MKLSKSKASRYSLLKHKKYREAEGLFLVQGEKAVKDTIANFDVDALVVKEKGDIDISVFSDYPLYEASESEMRKISTLETIPDILAVYKIPCDRGNVLTADVTNFSLVLDCVQDPGNLGTIIRTAHWFGISNIYCSIDTTDQYNNKVVSSTMGSLGKVRILYCDLIKLFEHNPDIPRYGLVLNGQDLFKTKNLKPGFIVMGNEGNGMRNEIEKKLTHRLTIPPVNNHNHPESLNVAIATAITLAQLIK